MTAVERETIQAMEMQKQSEPAVVAHEENGASDDVVDLVDNLAAAMESMLAHYGSKMPDADRSSRDRLVADARRFVAMARA